MKLEFDLTTHFQAVTAEELRCIEQEATENLGSHGH